MRKITESETSNKKIILGGGCFWCLEAAFNEIVGIEAISGYAGGTTKNPTYREVCSGTTGHAEVVKIIYNPEKISLKQILQIFFQLHDPTTLNRQGNDIGTQYRSIIFYQTPEENQIIKETIQEAQKKLIKPIVTEVLKLSEFYIAEDYHQRYYEKNPSEGYCRVIIKPKLEKLKKVVLPKLEFNL